MGRGKGSGQLSTSAGHRHTLVADAYAGFTSVFGDRRGSGRQPETELAAASRRELGPIFQALTAAVMFTTAEGDKALRDPGLRYLAVARSEYSDDLHIVGGGSEIDAALTAFEDEGAEDFAPEVIVDVGAADPDHCAYNVFRGTAGWYVHDDQYQMGLKDMWPGADET